ncbi:hypothetical protein GOP47_0027065 [Adiantum capillus-veneris]|nr:hypothetical protein GOP47_0027065 [Adiantum capillus-veneris]
MDVALDRLRITGDIFNPRRPVLCATCASSLTPRCIQFRPCIDIHKGKVKQIVGSTLSDQPGSAENLVTNFESEKSAAEYAQLYQRDGLFGGHVIMLGSDEASQHFALEAINAFPGGLQLGGGVTPSNAKKYLDNGASHVIVTSFIFTEGRLDFEKLKELVHVVGKHRLVIDLSCRRISTGGEYAVVTHRWQKFTDLTISKHTLGILSEYADEFLVHGVDVEGKRLGVDEELVSLLGQWSSIPVTYAGGVSQLEDLELIRVAGGGVVNVTVGSALDIFGGELSYKEVLHWHKQQESNKIKA